MNAHTKLKLHLSRHAYKRGRNKGDAPADSSRRSKSHFRVIQGNGGQMIVRMHNADLITAYEDGRIRLHTNGWHHSPTTRACMNDALCFAGRGHIGSVHKWGTSTTGIRMNGKTYRYYDGMEFSAEGELLTPPEEFMAKRVDSDETAEFRREVKESGFADVFPLLFQSSTAEDAAYVRSTKEAMTCEHLANQWPAVVAAIKFSQGYRKEQLHHNHKDAWRALIARCTKNMTVIVGTGVTVL
jgi:hypothetical protein